MPKHNKPPKELSPIQATRSQQDLVEILNPAIAIKKKEIIDRSRKASQGEWIDTGNLPDKFKHLESRPNFKHIRKCLLQIRPGRDIETCLIHFIDNAGVAHTGANYSEKKSKVPESEKYLISEDV